MKQQERDEIRAKHKPTVWYPGSEWEQTLCEECSVWQDGAIEVDSPCWAIKYVDTLGAWEAEKANDFTDEELMGIALIFGEFGLKDRFDKCRGVSVKAQAILEAREAS